MLLVVFIYFFLYLTIYIPMAGMLSTIISCMQRHHAPVDMTNARCRFLQSYYSRGLYTHARALIAALAQDEKLNFLHRV